MGQDIAGFGEVLVIIVVCRKILPSIILRRHDMRISTELTPIYLFYSSNLNQ